MKRIVCWVGLLGSLFFSVPSLGSGCFPSLPSMPKCSKNCDTNACCKGMGGVNYCDSSAGRLVCNNGFYSSCYCTRHAVMDMQHVQGCCLWQGGVKAITNQQIVLCRDGGYSEECSTMLLTNKQNMGID